MLVRLRSFLFLLSLSVSLTVSQAQVVLRDTVMNAFRVPSTQMMPRLRNHSEDLLCWKNAQPIHLDYQFEPRPGHKPSEETEAYLLYDDNAIYFMMYCHDKHIDSVEHLITKRGTVWRQTDNIYVFFDTYSDGQNAYGFGVSIDNVQDDLRVTNRGETLDTEWDAVWESATFVVADGWIAEMKIPYAAIRFPDKEVQHWSMDIAREIRRRRETISWCPIPPDVPAFIPMMQPIHQLNNIHSPLRLSVTPYASAYLFPQNNGLSFQNKIGADLKLGLSKSFTVDMTLIPDFGQVISDQLVKNLTAYEVQYAERRPFFLEGAELFAKNDLFYSRRIGEISNYHWYHDADSNYQFKNDVSQSNLLNAFKLSGKSANNLSVGVLNAVTQQVKLQAISRTGSEHEAIYEPFSNYNVLVVDKTIGKTNSHYGFINTSVLRADKGYTSNVTGADLKLLTKDYGYQLYWQGDRSYSDGYWREKGSLQSGYRQRLLLAKVKGLWQGGYKLDLVSDHFEMNEMGYLPKRNYFHQQLMVQKQVIQPTKHFLNSLKILAYDEEYYFANGQNMYRQLTAKFKADWRNYLTMVIYGFVQPFKVHDYYDPRVAGRFVVLPGNEQVGCYFSSDYRKTLAFDVSIDYNRWERKGTERLDWMIAPRWKVNRRLLINASSSWSKGRNQLGFCNLELDKIYFGERNVQNVENMLSGIYTISNRMSVNMNVRHYWSSGRYTRYYLLEENGQLRVTKPDFSADYDFNAWQMNLLYTWQIGPGRFVSFAWKNLINQDNAGERDYYLENLKYTFSQPLLNSISVKLLYYLDIGSKISARTMF